MPATSSSRRPRPLTVSKRLSSVRLSTDTTSSLPAYSSPPCTRPTSASDWPNPSHPPLDQPPDYPQSAEEADQEDDFVPLRGPRSTATRRLRHRRSDSSSIPPSPSVDDLLERSVVALELSTNALLQSMNTQSTISALANDQILERSLDRQTKMLDLRLRGSHSTHQGWMDDLDEVMKRVDSLFGEERQHDADLPVSRSLPTGSPHVPRRHTRPALLPVSQSDTAYLHLSTSELDVRDTLRPPRALTQYVSVKSTLGEACDATADLESIYLPSTTGLRSAARIQSFAASVARPHSLRKSVSSPGPGFDASPSTPAYNMLSHLASCSSSPSPSRTTTSPASQSSPSVANTTASRNLRRHSAGSVDTSTSSLRRSRSTFQAGSSVSIETLPSPPARAMTPPMEETTPSSSESSTSDHRINAFRTMQSLRKILDEAPPDLKGKRPAVQELSPRPTFQPRTPSVVPSSGTSMATASVSRLFTRSSHHASSLLHSKPKQSSLKPSLYLPSTPSNTDIPGHLTPASHLSSTPSTPRQVSFAQLPDSHSGRLRRKGKEKGKVTGKGKRGKGQDEGTWWSGWFTGSSHSGTGAARYDERMEDKVMRGWGRPGVGAGVADEWLL